MVGKALLRNLSRGTASSANVPGGEVPAPGTHNQQPEYLVFAIFIRSIPPAVQITGNWRKQAAGYRLATAGTISTHGLSQHLEVQVVALIRVLPSHRLIQRDTQARLI